MKNRRTFDLEERLIEFSLNVIKIADILPKSESGKYFSKQLIRSGTAPALNYAEAQGAESRKDFIHKMKIALKELRETYVCLKIIKKIPLIKDSALLSEVHSENNELISIFVKSIITASNNQRSKK